MSQNSNFNPFDDTGDYRKKQLVYPLSAQHKEEEIQRQSAYA